MGPCTAWGSPTAARPASSAASPAASSTRASLARALAGDPDLLLLDEPTNHLDIASLEWLEGYLTGLDAAVILVAHDRWFLEAVGTSVLELEAGRARFFPGPWHAWRREVAAREIALGKAIEKQQREIARMERFVERFRYKATKARQAQSRVKALDKMERIERDPRDNRSLGFSFGAAERTGRVVLELEDARLEVPGRTLLEDGELWLERGEHVSLVGPNGVGKTTLIEALAGRRPLEAGRLRTGHNVKLGYLSQHTQELGSTGTALEAAQRATGLTPGQGARPAGAVPVLGRPRPRSRSTGLSGGERRRLSLAVLVASEANVLILDEPTNHLDLDAREALEDALQAFERRVAARLPRPRAARRGRDPHDRVRGRPAAQLRGRLGRVRARARGARARPRPRAPAKRARSEAARRAGDGRRPRSGPSKNAVRRAGDLEREVERAEAALAAAGGRAGRPRDVEQPDAARAQHRAPRAGEARGRARPTPPGRRRSAGAPSSPSSSRVVVAVVAAALLDVLHVGARLGERDVAGAVERVRRRRPARTQRVHVASGRRCRRPPRASRCRRSGRSGSAGTTPRRRC